MANLQSRWENLQSERGIGFPPVRDPTQGMEIPTCSALRIRREANGRDYMNTRMWDNFRATPPTQVSSELLQADADRGDPRFMDMNPIGTRRSGVQFRHQLDYMPDTKLPPKENSANPYLQRMDAEGSESRNIVREFRGAVVEDNRERDVEASRKITDRQFQDRWLPPNEAEQAASIQAYELLRPKTYSDWAPLNGGFVASSVGQQSEPMPYS
jgi:hypothetical protein